jgi:hypothetical protein
MIWFYDKVIEILSVARTRAVSKRVGLAHAINALLFLMVNRKK